MDKKKLLTWILLGALLLSSLVPVLSILLR